MIDEDDRNSADDDAYDAAPLLTKNYGSCANASRLRLDPPSKRRRSFAQRRRWFCLIYGCGLGLLVGGVLLLAANPAEEPAAEKAKAS